MKRLSFVVALVAVLALAGTAGASPTINGTAKLTLTGNTASLKNGPTVDFKLGWDNSLSAKGDGWTLSGKMQIPDGNVTSLNFYEWKLNVKAGIFDVAAANAVDLGTLYDAAAITDGVAGKPSGNHLRVKLPVGPLSVTYDKASAQYVIVDVPKGAAAPVALGALARVGIDNPTAVAYTTWDMANGIVLKASVGQTTNKNDGLAYGATIDIPVTSNLKVYLVGQRWGKDWAEGGSAGNTRTLVQLTYTQPQYKAGAYLWRTVNSETGSLVGLKNYGFLSLAQVAGDNLDWFNPDYDYNWDPYASPGSGAYKNLKGVAFYARYGNDNTNKPDATASPNPNPTKLHLAVGAPVVAGRAWANAYAELTGPSLKGAEYWGHLYVKLSDKLNSTTKVKVADYTNSQSQTVKRVAVWNNLGYTISSTASVALDLTKEINTSDVGYTMTFSVKY